MPLVQVGATDISRYYILRDSTTHLPKTDVDVTTIDIYSIGYRAAIATKIDCTALASADASHTDGGAYHCGKGIYRIDWPDIWTGSIGNTVQLVVECSGVDTTFEEIELSPIAGAIAELTGDPGTNPNVAQILMLLYMWLRNDSADTPTLRTVKNNAGTTVLSATVSDTGSTFSQGKLG
jgi:hypothetical protein